MLGFAFMVKTRVYMGGIALCGGLCALRIRILWACAFLVPKEAQNCERGKAHYKAVTFQTYITCIKVFIIRL